MTPTPPTRSPTGIREGEIAILDEAYMDFGRLWELEDRGVTFVTRAKETSQYPVVGECDLPPGGKIVADEVIRWRCGRSTTGGQPVKG